MENMKAMFNKDVIEAMINARVKEMLKNLKLTFNFFLNKKTKRKRKKNTF